MKQNCWEVIGCCPPHLLIAANARGTSLAPLNGWRTHRQLCRPIPFEELVIVIGRVWGRQGRFNLWTDRKRKQSNAVWKLGSYYEYLRIKQVSSNMLRALTTTCLDMEAQSNISLSFVQVKLERTPPSHPGPNCRRSSSIMKKKVVAHLPHGALQIFVRKAITMRK